MKDYNSMNDKKIVLQKVWKLFQALRGDVNAEDYHVVLLFIYLLAENQLFQQLHPSHQPKIELVEFLKRANDATLQKVFDVFLPAIERSSERSMSRLLNLLATEDSEWLQQNIDSVFDMCLSSYLEKESTGVKLGEILKTNTKSDSFDSNINAPELSLGCLKNDNINFRLTYQDVSDKRIDASSDYFEEGDLFHKEINYSCLLVSRLGELRPTYFEFGDKPVRLGFSIPVFDFLIDESVVDVAYLVNELHSDYVTEQIDDYSSKKLEISKEDFLNVTIKLPSLAEQRAKVEGLKQSAKRIAQLQSELNKLKEEGGDKFEWGKWCWN